MQQFEKLWQVFDDAVKKGEYKSIPKKLTDGKDGRCANGLLLTYIDPSLDLTKGMYDKEISNVFKNVVKPRFNIDEDITIFNDFSNKNTNEIALLLKEKYEKFGFVDHWVMTALNNSGYDFAQLRDLFKEMDA